jgi:hypothetical protein
VEHETQRCRRFPGRGFAHAGRSVCRSAWERGHEYEARGCKYEYKSGPDGFKEEYKCDGGGPRYAGGPPPWAPAHGWRRKHAQHYEAGYVIPDLGIEFGRCNRDVIGAVIGGAAGGAIGSRIGKGSAAPSSAC